MHIHIHIYIFNMLRHERIIFLSARTPKWNKRDIIWSFLSVWWEGNWVAWIYQKVYFNTFEKPKTRIYYRRNMLLESMINYACVFRTRYERSVRKFVLLKCNIATRNLLKNVMAIGWQVEERGKRANSRESEYGDLGKNMATVIHGGLLSRNKCGSFATKWLIDENIDKKKKHRVNMVNLVTEFSRESESARNFARRR